MKQLIRLIIFVPAIAVSATVSATTDFDGSKRLICAPVEAMDCATGEECVKGRPEDIGAPAFLRIDFAKKVIIGEEKTNPIRFMENKEGQLLLQGNELGQGWAIAIDQATGKLSGALVHRTGVFVLFGSCTPI